MLQEYKNHRSLQEATRWIDVQHCVCILLIEREHRAIPSILHNAWGYPQKPFVSVQHYGNWEVTEVTKVHTVGCLGSTGAYAILLFLGTALKHVMRVS